jgi:hypothetical protein
MGESIMWWMNEQIAEGLEYEKRDGVGIWKVESLAEALESGALEAGEDHFREHAGHPEMSGTVVEMGDAETGGSDILDHVAEEWTALAEETNIERTAYVADGLARMAVAQKNEADNHTSKGFTNLEEAVEWASEV